MLKAFIEQWRQTRLENYRLMAICIAGAAWTRGKRAREPRWNRLRWSVSRTRSAMVSLLGRTVAFLTVGGDLRLPIVEGRVVGKAAEVLKQ